MIEIILLVLMCRDIGKIVRKSGRNALGYQFALVGLWVGGEVLGLLVGLVVAAVLGSAGNTLLAYGFALAGAIIGAVIAFRIAKATKPAPIVSGFPVVMSPPAESIEEQGSGTDR